MKYNKEEIMEILEEKKILSEKLAEFVEDSSIEMYCSDAQLILQYCQEIENWMDEVKETVDGNERYTEDETMNNIFTDLLMISLQDKRQDKGRLSNRGKARLLADIGTPGIFRSKNKVRNLLLELLTSWKHETELIDMVISNTPNLLPSELLDIVIADSNSDSWLSTSKHFQDLFEITEDKDLAIELIYQSNINLSFEVKSTFNAYKLEQEFTSKTRLKVTKSKKKFKI